MNNTSRQIFQLSKPLSPLVLKPLKAVAETANSLDFRYFLAGATARDLILENVFGRTPGRLTRDLDFGVAVSDWGQFEQFKTALIETRQFEAGRAIQQAFYLDPPAIKVKIDLIPFGGIQTGFTISWPPANDVVMNVAGFSEALEAAIHVRVDNDLVVPVASLPGLVILKIFAWADRKHEKRDAPDILKILMEYADAGNEDRLYTEELSLLEAAQFDIANAGATLLGKDARRIASGETATNLARILEDENLREELVSQMVQSGARFDDSFADRCALLLDSFRHGFAGD